MQRALLLFCLMTSTVAAQQPEVVTVMSKALTDIPDKEGLMITVEYPPGGADPVHRHNAHAFVYVLEGSVVMQVKGGKEVTQGGDVRDLTEVRKHWLVIA
jgi:quercetin dioxygenase-like cupin family protein